MIEQINSKLKGVTFEDRPENIKHLVAGQELFWIHQADNVFDPNAIMVFADVERIRGLGHLSREMAEKFVGWIAAGESLRIVCKQITGTLPNQSFGVNIAIYRS